MATTDSNGMVFYTVSDPVEPLQTVLNAMSTATTNALNATVRIFHVANVAARNALAAVRVPSTSNPLVVYRDDSAGIEYSVTPGTWIPGTPAPAWTTYTPTLTGSTTNPTLSAATGQYARFGKSVVVNFGLTISAGGSGTYTVSLPVPGVTTGNTQGSARLYDSSSGQAVLGARVSLSGASALQIQATTPQTSLGAYGTLANVANNVPWVWANGDILDGFVIYEAA